MSDLVFQKLIISFDHSPMPCPNSSQEPKKMTISEFIMSYVRPNIPHDEPNEETKKAMRDADHQALMAQNTLTCGN